MFAQNIAFALALSGAFASPLLKRDACSDACSATYNTCRGQPNANRATCASQYSSCLGYLPFDDSGSLVTPTACSTTAAATPTVTSSPKECAEKCSTSYNTCRGKPDANRATCAAEYSSCLGYLPFNDSGSLVTPTACSATTAATPTATSDPKACAEKCSVSYNTCRGKPDANRATCAAEYSSCLGYLPFNDSGSLVTPTACSSTTAAPTFTSIPGIPGGCNPAHPGSCPSSYFTQVTHTATATITQAPAPTNVAPAPATNAGWTVKNLSRYCAENGSGCDYNFKISTNDGTPDESCTVIRIDVKDALTESWYDQPCTTGSENKVSWGYSAQFETPFAVLTVVNQKKKSLAYFGVSNVNGQAATPSNPKGSGSWADIGPQPVYAL